jgi:hypothetical protein
MADVRMFRTISGEDVIGEFVKSTEQGDVYINTIQLVVVPSRKNPEEQSYGFAPFPQYSQPKSEGKLVINPKLIPFFIDVDEQFLDQYNTIYGHIVAPTPKIILGR